MKKQSAHRNSVTVASSGSTSSLRNYVLKGMGVMHFKTQSRIWEGSRLWFRGCGGENY